MPSSWHARDVLDFFATVQRIDVVDGHRFPTSTDMLSALFASDIFASKKQCHIVLHGTPRQLDDRRRLFVAAEQRTFAHFAEAQPFVEDKRYFVDETPTLEQHFACLDVFN